ISRRARVRTLAALVSSAPGREAAGRGGRGRRRVAADGDEVEVESARVPVAGVHAVAVDLDAERRRPGDGVVAVGERAVAQRGDARELEAAAADRLEVRDRLAVEGHRRAGAGDDV